MGEWLPEPLLTSPDVADDVELAESVSIAMLTVLETLGPTERAVFVLREVFDVPYDEIAVAVDKSPAAVRQIAHRAKDHVAARRPRMDVVRSEHEEVVERFVAALNTGDLQGLMDVLAPDVVSVADGGGKVRGAALRPIIGADRIARYLVGRAREVPGRIPRVAGVGERAAGDPGRGGRAVGGRREPERRGWADHAYLLDGEPREVGLGAGRGRVGSVRLRGGEAADDRAASP